jgi:hypothetical protein
MLKGINMTLMVGPAVPVPVPQVVLDSLQSVKVTTSTSAKAANVFELSFSLSNRSPLHTLFLLAGGANIPILRVIIIVTLNGMPNVLIDGVVANVQVQPGSDSSHSTLVVSGGDLTNVMDLIDFTGIPYPAMPVEAQVLLILAKYAALGIVPLIIPRILFEVPLPTKQILRHCGKDLGYVQKLADDAGYVFYLEPGPVPGVSVAYWGPEVKVGLPQPALNINMDALTNVESLSFRFDGDKRKLPVIYIQTPLNIPIPIPIPDIGLLNPPLGLIPPIPKGLEPIETTAKLTVPKAILRGLSMASKSADSVSGSGTLDVLRYGRVLKARKLVGVRGAGTAYDGLYYVDSVTHDIKRGEYKQQFTLKRNGLVSTVPRVPA